MARYWNGNRRGSLRALALVGVLATLVAGTWSGLREPQVATGELRSGWRVLKLAEGSLGEVAVQTTDPIQVRWRGPGERGWSRPVVAYAPSDRYWLHSSVRVRGATVAIRAAYSSVPPSDEAMPPSAEFSTVFIACQPRRCWTSEAYERVVAPECRRGSCEFSRPESQGVSQVPEFDAAGERAFFGVTERGYALWDPRAGFRDEPTAAPSAGSLPGTPMLAPDGTFRLVSGAPRPGGCRFTLLVSSGFLPRFQPAATYNVDSASPNCNTVLESFATDYVIVHTDRDRDPTYAVREGQLWSPVEQDPSGMMRFHKEPGRTAVGSVVRTGFWHWREVVTGSPDGRRLLAQVHFPGERTWTRPVLIARLRSDVPCREIAPTSEPAKEPFYVTLICRSRPNQSKDWAYSYVHALTEDGVRWRSFEGTDLPTRVGGDLFFGGAPAMRWTAGQGLAEVPLAVPEGGVVTPTDDGSYVLVIQRLEAGRCLVIVRVAEPGSTQWSEPIENEIPVLPDGGRCSAGVQYDGVAVGIYPTRPEETWTARVMRRSGQWVVRVRSFSA